MAGRTIKFATFKEHVQKKSMWIGSNLLSENEHWILEGNKFVKKTIQISDALLKCFDEILVNALDQYIRSPDFKPSEGGAVTYINIKLDGNKIIISNNGRGIPIYYADEIQQYSVQALISREFSGTNFDEDPDRVVGGVNGLGIKLININSVYFEIETIDTERQLCYRQICRNNMNIIEKPEISKYDGSVGHTTISFIPDYAKLCRINNDENPNWLNEDNMYNFKKLIEARCYQVAAFISCINYRYELQRKIEYKKKAKIYFNGEHINVPNLSKYMHMFGIEELCEFEISGDNIRFPWTICVGKANSKETVGLISLINGVYLPKGGSHITMLFNQIIASVKNDIDAMIKDSSIEFKDSHIKKLLFVIDVRQIPLPQFAGQTKDSITISMKDLAIMKKIYQIPKTAADKIWKMIKDALEYKLSLQEFKTSTKKKKMSHIRGYKKADKLGLKSKIFLEEGNSAHATVMSLIMNNKTPLDRNRVGTYNLFGVPINVLKMVDEIIIDGETKLKQKNILQKNLTFQGLVCALNLDYNHTYYCGADPEKRKKGDKEFQSLHYGEIIICADQDSDGIGLICSLVIVFIATFWPNLIKRNFVKRLQTPLIRVYMPPQTQVTKNVKIKKAQVYEFYSQRNFEQWVINNYGTEDNVPENIKKNINYYKGLGSHTAEEIQNMAINIYKNIITITWDDVSKIKMDEYYGPDSTKRKEILKTPVTCDYTDEMLTSLKVPISAHLDIESKAFQLYFIKRKLKNAIDGFLPSQRKAFAAARIMLKKETKCKVFQLCGYASKQFLYAHGDASLNAVITMMAQAFTGSNNIPIIRPFSDGVGSRIQGRSVFASPRYTFIGYNYLMDIIFPPQDDWLLDYVYEDGEMAEPKYYVPIIPMSILEHCNTTAVGFKIDIWARDLQYTLHNLRAMIRFDYKPMGFLGKVWVKADMNIHIGKAPSGQHITEICTGQYSICGDVITVTQLPLRIWSHNFECDLLGIDPKSLKSTDDDGNAYSKKDLVLSVSDKTNKDQNDIEIVLKPGAIEEIESNYGTSSLDPITHYLGLYQVLDKNLNLIGKDQSVKQFESYEEIMIYWFEERKKLYIQRIEREIILLELNILYNTNLLRFMLMDAKKEINIDCKPKNERNAILESHNFQRFNKETLISPKYLKPDELKTNILKNGASYHYIDEITKGMTESSYLQKIEDKIKMLTDNLNTLKQKTWRDIWLSEIDAAEKQILEGIRTNWQYSDVKYEFC